MLHAVAPRHNLVTVVVFKFEMPHSYLTLNLTLKSTWSTAHYGICKIASQLPLHVSSFLTTTMSIVLTPNGQCSM